MQEKEKKIYVDQAGYEQLLKNIEVLKEKIRQNNLEKGEAYSGAVGDGWHDNFAFDEANRQERMLLGQLQEYYDQLSKIVIIEQSQDDISKIDIGDIVSVNIILSSREAEPMQFKLVATLGATLDQEIPEVTINSPMGKAVYGKTVGAETSYKVGERNFKVQIIGKDKELDKSDEIIRK